MFNRSNCDQKSQLSGILTEPLNPRDKVLKFILCKNSAIFQSPNLVNLSRVSNPPKTSFD